MEPLAPNVTVGTPGVSAADPEQHQEEGLTCTAVIGWGIVTTAPKT